jgi:hypothetical protein
MATSRYSGAITPTSYVHHPLEAAFKVGLTKDAGIQDIIDSGQDFLNTEGNYATVFNPDTEYKISKVNSLVQGMNDLVTGNLNDPVTQNKLRGLRTSFSNDKEVYDSIQRTNAFNEYQKNVEKLGKDYRDQNALPYLDAVKRYQLGDKSAANILKLPPSIDPYYDGDKEFHDSLKDIGDMGISFVNGDFIDNTQGKFATDGKGGIVSDDRIGELFSHGLSSEAYQQFQKDYNFEVYNGSEDIGFNNWLANKAKSAQFTYSNAINKLDYTGRSLGYAKFNFAKDQVTNPLGVVSLQGTPKEIGVKNQVSNLIEEYGANAFNPWQNKNMMDEKIIPGITGMIKNLDSKSLEVLSKKYGLDFSSSEIKALGGKDNYTKNKNMFNMYADIMGKNLSRVLPAYGLTGINENKLAERLSGYAKNDGVQGAINGKLVNGEQLSEALNSLEGNTDQAGVLMSPSDPIFDGRPSVQFKTNTNQTVTVGLDDTNIQGFSGIRGIYKSLTEGNFSKEGTLIGNGDNGIEYYAVNSMDNFDEQGDAIMETVVEKRINGQTVDTFTPQSLLYSEDNSKQTLLTQFMNSNLIKDLTINQPSNQYLFGE